MNNLFICATPYHIILASGICKNRFKQDKNTILIYENFNLDDININSIKSVFDEIIIIDGELSKCELNILGMIKLKNKIVNDLKTNILKHKYDNIFVNNENTVESQYVINKLKRLNKNINIIGIEDGSSVYNGLNIENNKYKIILKSILYKFKVKDIKILGSDSYIKEINVLWPKLVRTELDNKIKKEIQVEELIEGIKLSFKKTDINIEYNSIIIILDNSKLYEDSNVEIERYKLIIKDIIEKNYDKNIYFKYHPIESNDYMKEYKIKYSNLIELKRNIPSELILYNCYKKNVTLIGNHTTSLITAKKILESSKIISLIKLTNIRDFNMENVFRRLGIMLPEKKESIQAILHDKER